MNIAVILSAGSGSRFGSNTPKQFINLAGKNIIEYTIAAFEQNEKIDAICVVADLTYHKKLKKIVEENGFKKIQKIIQGGDQRKDSSYNAIKEYGHLPHANLIFHDAVRPFVSQKIINDTINALQNYNAIDVAIPTADTIIQVDNTSKTIENIPQRSKLQRGQTPQAFKLEIIQKAHELANADKNEPLFTDDCGLVKQYLPQEKIYVVVGEERNIKITYPEDLLFGEKLLQFSSMTLFRENTLAHLKDKVIVVFGGSSGIGKNIVLQAKENGAVALAFSRANAVDVADYKQVEKAFDGVFQKYEKIDYVINCAATLTKKELVAMRFEEIVSEINTNFLGSINVAKSSYKYLKQTRGSLLFFTSSSYTRGRADYSIYSSTKAAIVNLTQSLAQEWQKDCIKVNVINPARTATPMRKRCFPNEDTSILLNAEIVAEKTLQALLEDFSGLVVDVRNT
ncbi:MAG TPA: 2-C-methyl-D-erythritol 4-phosphate cytidylyltransferase [Sulfurimonas sp. UBA12504]|nr:MAG TPA: 2-C-methyl-D-erythritol 4-phosphate cytidylyltransferase [Sulfurimonas sp. UBA12504]